MEAVRAAGPTRGAYDRRVTTPGSPGYALLDFGDRRRLERFGPFVLDRPALAADGPRQAGPAWTAADARYERLPGGAGRWVAAGAIPTSWEVDVDGLRLEVRPAPSGQVGVFPEHRAVARWTVGRASAAARRLGRSARVLNLFGGTGLVTIALARAGAAVAHVDASRPAIARARANAAASGLAEAPIRWLLDDAVRFVRREARRGSRYDGVVLDPPTYGHGPAGDAWALGQDLGALLAMSAGLVESGGFVAVTAHARQLDGPAFAAAVRDALGRRTPDARPARLDIETSDGRRLPAGWAVLAELA